MDTMSDNREQMDRIASFEVDHTRLRPGVYVSRRDMVGDQVLTTFDIRMTTPNVEPAMDIGGIHAIEHLGATYFRSQEYKDKIIYFGPMGCCTGFYLIVIGSFSSGEIVGYVTKMMEFISNYMGEVPGANPRECGNYLTLNLPMARYYARKYLLNVLNNITPERLLYPE